MNRLDLLRKYIGKKAVVYDIDNTLLDVRERLMRSIEEVGGDPLKGIGKLSRGRRERFWKVFLSSKYLYLDKPNYNVIRDVNKMFDDGFIVILLTGRPEYMRRDTVEQLKKFNIKYHVLLMRPNDNREPDYMYKPKVFSKIMDLGIDVIEYHEDDEKTIEVIKKLYPQVKIFRHSASIDRFFS